MTHMAASVFALLGMVILIVQASAAGKPWHVVSFTIYGASLFFMFLVSTLHHSVKAAPKTRARLRALDYIAIFFLITGSMTPICLIVLRGPLGWSVLGVGWTVALVGVALRGAWHDLPKWVTTTLYVTLGWLCVVLAYPLLRAIGWHGLLVALLGGVFYTVGAAIFAMEKPNPIPGIFGFHEIWHLLVIAGAATHYGLMYWFVLPA